MIVFFAPHIQNLRAGRLFRRGRNRACVNNISETGKRLSRDNFPHGGGSLTYRTRTTYVCRVQSLGEILFSARTVPNNIIAAFAINRPILLSLLTDCITIFFFLFGFSETLWRTLTNRNYIYIYSINISRKTLWNQLGRIIMRNKTLKYSFIRTEREKRIEQHCGRI